MDNITTYCPIELTIKLISGKWKVEIIRNIAKKNNRFNILIREIKNISRNVLSKELTFLIDNDVIYKYKIENTYNHYYYVLTPKGNDLFKLLKEIYNFGISHETKDRQIKYII